jgi:hypothetical protein
VAHKRYNLKLSFPEGSDHDPIPCERVHDGTSELRCLAYGEGYVMCRRKGCIPFIVDRKRWLEWRGRRESKELNGG